LHVKDAFHPPYAGTSSTMGATATTTLLGPLTAAVSVGACTGGVRERYVSANVLAVDVSPTRAWYAVCAITRTLWFTAV